MDLGNGFARHARLQKAADAAVLVASYVYDENHPAEMYRVAEQYLQANLDNEEDRALSLDEIRKKYDMKLYGRKAQDSTKTAGVLLTLDATEKIGSKFIEFVGIHGFSVDVRATTKVVVKKQSRDSGVFGYSFICGDTRTASPSGDVWDWQAEKRPPFTLLNYKHKIIGKVHSNGDFGINGVYDQTVNHGYNTFEVWGQRFKTIIADGDISIYSNMIPADPKQPMAIISLHGNVKLWVDSPVKAVVYAPNGEINFEGIKTNGQTEYSFEGSMVGKRITLNGKESGVGDYITYKWNDFNFGTADFGKPNSGSSSGESDSGTESVSSVILHKNEDSDYEEASSKNELKL